MRIGICIRRANDFKRESENPKTRSTDCKTNRRIRNRMYCKRRNEEEEIYQTIAMGSTIRTFKMLVNGRSTSTLPNNRKGIAKHATKNQAKANQ